MPESGSRQEPVHFQITVCCFVRGEQRGRLLPEGRFRLDFEQIRRDMRDRQGNGGFKLLPEICAVLTGQSEHQIDGHIPKARIMRGEDGFFCLLCRVPSAEYPQRLIGKGLHADGQPVDARRSPCGKTLRRDGQWVCLECDFGIRQNCKTGFRRGEHSAGHFRREQRGCSAAEVDRIRRHCLRQRGEIPADRFRERGGILCAVLSRIEVTVGTFHRAERHMDIDAGVHSRLIASISFPKVLWNIS